MGLFKETFTEEADDFTISDNDTYYLKFLGGNDLMIVNGSAANKAWMGEGHDYVRLNKGGTTVWMEAGNDKVIGSAGLDVMDGGDGDDVLTGGDWNFNYGFGAHGGAGDRIYGGKGNDTILNHGDNALYKGGDDNDLFEVSGTGNAYGEGGNDYFEQEYTDGSGVHRYGGIGDDTYEILGMASLKYQHEEADQGIDTLISYNGSSFIIPTNFENLILYEVISPAEVNPTLTGNTVANYIQGSKVNEKIWGLEGNDTLDGGAGTDNVYGGIGDDVLKGGVGTDMLDGGVGHDRLDGGDGYEKDTMYGRSGNDTYVVDTTLDKVVEYAGEGMDTVESKMASTTLGANVENLKIIAAGAANGTGNTLDNVIIGNDFANTLRGLDGSDVIDAGKGDDTVIGDVGSDVLKGGAGADVLEGGWGHDQMQGGSENDQLFGGVGDDVLDGGSGNDTLHGQENADIIRGGEGADFAYGGHEKDSLYGDAGDDFLSGQEQADTVYGGEGNDFLSGGADDDDVYGEAGADRLFGGDGWDLLHGDDGNDVLRGDGGTDNLYGGFGNDILVGGAGTDALYGSHGSDRFVFDSVANTSPADFDAVMDFQKGLDRLDFSQIDANTTLAGNQAFSFYGMEKPFFTSAGTLWAESWGDGTTVTLYGDVDGDGVEDLEVYVNFAGDTDPVFSVSDFIL